MRSDSQFCLDVSDVVSRLSDERVAILCEVLAVVLVTRAVSPSLGFMTCAHLLRSRAAAEESTRPPIFSASCEPPPAR